MKKKIIEETKRINPDLNTGLLPNEIEIRKANGDVNNAESETGKTYLQIILGNVFTFFNLLMFAIALLFIMFVGLKSIGNMSFIVIVTVNILIGTIQECKSKRTIEKARLMTMGKNTVKRNGKEVEVFPNEILLDDIVILKAGDQIPADCIIREGRGEINESLLTGESTPVKKKEDDELFAGSFVISGYCIAQVMKIGKDTYIYSIESKAKDFKKPKSKLMTSITSLIKKLTYIVIPLGLITFWTALIANAIPYHAYLANIKAGMDPAEAAALANGIINVRELVSASITTGGAAMIGMIPAGMILLASVAMATGVMKLAKKKTLVQDLYSVESLSRIDTLCLDKTGTLTDGTMTVEDVIEFQFCDIKDIMSAYLSADKSPNLTSKAMIERFGNHETHKIIDTIEFSSARKYSAVKFEDLGTYVLGAPEYLTKDIEVLKKARGYQSNGVRVLLLAKINDEIIDEKLPEEKEIVAMFLIRDNIRQEVKGTMEWFAANDVDIYVISGDNTGTVSYIAKQSGIKNWDKVVDMSQVNDDTDIDSLIMNNRIFGRVSPEQKALIIDTLKAHGRTVGVTGDGVNDILAMKKSDCAIALANGAPATKNIANLVLMDSNFNNMQSAVLEGRRVVNNVQRSATLFLMKNFFFMFLIMFTILIGIAFPIETSVMGLINIFVTGIGSLLLSIEPSASRIEGNFLKNVLSKAIPAGFFMFLPCAFLIIYSFARVGLDTTAVNAFIADPANAIVPVFAICIVIAGFIVFYKVCRPFTKYRAILFTVLLSIVVLLSLAIPEFFMNNSTVYWGKLLAENDGFGEVLRAFFGDLFSLKLYKQFRDQWFIIIGFALLSSFLYLLSDWIITKLFKVRMFDKLEDEDR